VTLIKIGKARTLGRYRLGPYEALVLDNIHSKDPVDYYYILALYQDGVKDPIFFVTSEAVPTPSAGKDLAPVVCTYEGDRRIEGDASSSWEDYRRFVAHAFQLVAQKYALPVESLPKMEDFLPLLQSGSNERAT
jgi:hypothetical protein